MNNYMQLIFPKDESDSYFQEMARVTLNKLSQINHFSFQKGAFQIVAFQPFRHCETTCCRSNPV